MPIFFGRGFTRSIANYLKIQSLYLFFFFFPFFFGVALGLGLFPTSDSEVEVAVAQDVKLWLRPPELLFLVSEDTSSSPSVRLEVISGLLFELLPVSFSSS